MSSRPTLTDRINRLFRAEDWKKARALLERELEKTPDSHWLLTRLSTTYCEERKYKKALHLVQQAAAGLPVGTLGSRGGFSRGRKLHGCLRCLCPASWRGASGDKGTPPRRRGAWADALWVDSMFRVAVCLEHLGKKRQSMRFLEIHLRLPPMCPKSIYSVEDVAKRLSRLSEEEPGYVDEEFNAAAQEVGELCKV